MVGVPEKSRLTLAQAMAIANRPTQNGEPPTRVQLACGFTPLHLATFLKAYGKMRFPGADIGLEAGLFEDLSGSISRIPPASEALVIIEWSDLDPRLGLRHSGGWMPSLFPDIEREVASRLKVLAAALLEVGQHSVAVVAGPTLPLPPIGFTIPAQDTGFELRLSALVASTLGELSSSPNLRILSGQELAMCSPMESRMDASLALAAGFPYSLSHAEALARLLIDVLFPAEPRKGLITDLDDTLWLGILGEIGSENVGWSLETHAQQHGLYQQYLAALAERGVLVAIASKNDPELVTKALSRPDFLCARSAIFPVECRWGAKSASIARVLKTWNIAARDVVFVDDSPMELAEVSAAFPEITCLQFPRNDTAGLWRLLENLRRIFGHTNLQDEDRIRAASLRSQGQMWGESDTLASDDFIRRLEGNVSLDFSKDSRNTRAFELVNTTNQFHLNGRRWAEREWMQMLKAPDRFLLTVSYADKFGPLGRIAVLSGEMTSSTLHIETWVMSCRAFSRRIEYEVLSRLIALWSPERIKLDYVPTERNGPLRQFILSILDSDPDAVPAVLSAAQYAKSCPALYHAVTELGSERHRHAAAASLSEDFAELQKTP